MFRMHRVCFNNFHYDFQKSDCIWSLCAYAHNRSLQNTNHNKFLNSFDIVFITLKLCLNNNIVVYFVLQWLLKAWGPQREVEAHFENSRSTSRTWGPSWSTPWEFAAHFKNSRSTLRTRGLSGGPPWKFETWQNRYFRESNARPATADVHAEYKFEMNLGKGWRS